mmetsp:Transcript_3022/g.9010  ORF Transcript_3022/g.9010 Transcript_3022/m.9010 type:complete len:213 (+) Transcript_3022:356-994(+)
MRPLQTNSTPRSQLIEAERRREPRLAGSSVGNPSWVRTPKPLRLACDRERHLGLQPSIGWHAGSHCSCGAQLATPPVSTRPNSPTPPSGLGKMRPKAGPLKGMPLAAGARAAGTRGRLVAKSPTRVLAQRSERWGRGCSRPDSWPCLRPRSWPWPRLTQPLLQSCWAPRCRPPSSPLPWCWGCAPWRPRRPRIAGSQSTAIAGGATPRWRRR